MLSNKFFESLLLIGKPYHRIAWEAGLRPSQLYKITAGIDRPGRTDPRVVALCKYLGLPIDEAFKRD
jgi:hypothetical protein